MPGKRRSKKPPKELTVRDLNHDTDEIISFTRKPEVLVHKFPHPEQPETFVHEQSDGSKIVYQTPTDQGPDVIWLFFGRSCLVGIVKLDNLPLRFESKQTCRDVWPTELTFPKTRRGQTSPSLEAKMSDGTEIKCSPWNPTVVYLNDSLWGTDMFWEPLDEDHGEFTSEELKAIRQITKRDSVAVHQGRNTKGADERVFRYLSDFTVVMYGPTRLTFRPEKAHLVKILCKKYWDSKGTHPWVHHTELAGTASRQQGYSYANPRYSFRPESPARQAGLIRMKGGSLCVNLEGFAAREDAGLR